MPETPLAAPIRTRVWRHGRLEAENFPFEQVSDYAAEPDTVVWADLFDPDATLVAQIAEELELDPHAVEDALAERERPKAVHYDTHKFVTASPVRFDRPTDQLVAGRVSAFCTHRVMVTVRLDDTLDLDAVVHRWDEGGMARFGPVGLLHGVLDEIVDRYLDILDRVDDRIDDVEGMLFDDDRVSRAAVTHRTFVLRRAVVDARRAMTPLRDVVSSLRRNVAGNDELAKLVPYYDDLQDHILHVAETLETLRDSVTSVFDTSMSLGDARMNTIMKKLTSWAAIIAVPTAVTGFYGQNVPYPGFGEHAGFIVSLVVMVVIAVALYVTFRLRDWL